MTAEVRIRTGLLLAALLPLSGCAVPSARDSLTSTLAAPELARGPRIEWRRDEAADEAVQGEIRRLLAGGVTAESAIAVAYLASPELQLALERIEVSRADLVAATRLPNPTAIVGVREPGGALAAFYPTRTVTVGLLQNVLALLNQPARRRIAEADLGRAQLEAADRIVGIAAEVNQAWIELVTAERVEAIRRQSLEAGRAAVDRVVVGAANRKEFGIVDVANERGTLYGLETQSMRARLDVQTARAALARLMGTAGRYDEWVTKGDLPGLPASDPDLATLTPQALQGRLDLRAARQAVAVRLRLLSMQRRFRWLGTLELGVFRESASGGMSFTGPNAVIELPVFDQRQSQLLASDAEYRSARRTLEQLVLAAHGELRTHAAEVTATRSMVEKYRDAVLPNQRQLSSRIDQGSQTLAAVERLRLQQSILGSEEQALQLLRDYWRARGALARAAGAWESVGLAAR
ncbi:MAG: hypothetical protein RLZZ200_579 [Pseudomonadota bacterium]|jgi:outer membrane protein TolC